MSYEVVVHGVRELHEAFADLEVRVDPELAKALVTAAQPIKDDIKRRAEPFSPVTSAGVRIRRRGTFIRVEQGQRKTTGYHWQHGGFQQRNFFDPALAEHQGEAVTEARAAVDAMVARVNALP